MTEAAMMRPVARGWLGLRGAKGEAAEGPGPASRLANSSNTETRSTRTRTWTWHCRDGDGRTAGKRHAVLLTFGQWRRHGGVCAGDTVVVCIVCIVGDAYVLWIIYLYIYIYMYVCIVEVEMRMGKTRCV